MSGGEDIVNQSFAHSNANATFWPARDNSHREPLAGGDGQYPEVIAHRVWTAVASMEGGLTSRLRPTPCPLSPRPFGAGLWRTWVLIPVERVMAATILRCPRFGVTSRTSYTVTTLSKDCWPASSCSSPPSARSSRATARCCAIT
jgi:hypothetical protein